MCGFQQSSSPFPNPFASYVAHEGLETRRLYSLRSAYGKRWEFKQLAVQTLCTSSSYSRIAYWLPIPCVSTL